MFWSRVVCESPIGSRRPATVAGGPPHWRVAPSGVSCTLGPRATGPSAACFPFGLARMTQARVMWHQTFRACVTTGVSAIVAAGLYAQPSGGGAGSSIRGVAVDSLRGAPLVGAEVMIAGTTTATVSDSTGAFRFDNLKPGEYRLGLFHPTLDSLGIGVSSPLMTVGPGETAPLILAIPSAEHLIGLFCQGRPLPRDSGSGWSMVIGRILDADTEEPIVGARVALTWTDIVANREIGLRHVDRDRETATGPAGAFHLCWLPSDATGALHAARSYDGEVVERPFAIADRTVVIMQLHVPDAVSSPTGASVTGYVLGEDGEAVGGALIRLSAAPGLDSARSDNEGRFFLRGLPSGSRAIVVRAVGYKPTSAPVELSARHPASVVVSLGRKPVVLPAVEVLGRLKDGYHRVGFDRRQQGSIGRFLTLADIQRHNATEFHDLLIGVSGLTLSGLPDGRLYLTSSHLDGCIRYLVDGQQFPQYQPDDIDTLVLPNSIGGIEVYEPGEAPGEIAYGPGVATCTVIVIWTKTMLRVF